MIELVSETRCILCNKCMQVCPMNVFTAGRNAPPLISRQDATARRALCVSSIVRLTRSMSRRRWSMLHVYANMVSPLLDCLAVIVKTDGQWRSEPSAQWINRSS